MVSDKRSGRLLIPRSRRLTIDVLHFHKQVPTCAHDRIFELGRLAALRSEASTRISWAILFIKAFAIVAARRPILRQTFQPWPWPHIYQHSQNVGMLATSRVHDNEAWVFLSRFEKPEEQTLDNLQIALDHYTTQPVRKIFKQQWQLSGLPTILRRVFWWWSLNVSLAKRAHRAGTFFFTTLAAKGVEIQDPPSFFTSNLTYGPLDDEYRCRVTLSYDHRLMDGSTVADCLIELENVLNGPIAEELRSLMPRSSVDDLGDTRKFTSSSVPGATVFGKQTGTDLDELRPSA